MVEGSSEGGVMDVRHAELLVKEMGRRGMRCGGWKMEKDSRSFGEVKTMQE